VSFGDSGGDGLGACCLSERGGVLMLFEGLRIAKAEY